MPNVLSDPMFSHWSTLFENMSASPKEFYEAFEAALKRRQIPLVGFGRVLYPEAGALSPRREYFRVKREELLFDVCAAPFGTGFFFSWWLTSKERRWGLVWGLLLLLIVSAGTRFLFPILAPALANLIGSPLLLMSSINAGVLYGLLAVLIFFAILWISALLARTGFTLFEEMILSIPFIGWFYAWIFRPLTYYRIDTMLMFEEAVHGAVLEVIDGMTSGKGIRTLSELERKPIHRAFMRS